MKKMISKKNFPVDEDGILVLRGELFWRWRSADTEVRNAELQLKLKQAEVAKLLEQYPEVRTAIDERSAMINKSVLAQNDLRAVYKDLEAHLGMKMSDMSIDDQTGRVYVIKDGEVSPVVLSGSKKSRPNGAWRRIRSTNRRT